MEKRKSEKKLVRGNSLWGRKNQPTASGNRAQQEDRSDRVQYVQSPYDALPTPENNQSRVSLGMGDDYAPSIVPDVSPEGAAWQTQELELATLSLIQFRARHPIHNPLGPRWYKNHHILPPQTKIEQRPPSMFSPSFPPMAASIHTQSQDSNWAPGPSRTPSGSPLPTPNSSQTRINDPQVKVRSRKTSQTAHDEVDLMDGTDPWGQQWHHQSPYDVGLTRQGVESRESMVPKPHNQQNGIPRTRRASFSTGIGRHKTVTPSPLSQSTSAIHLQSQQASTLDPSTIGVPRRLSKRRKPFQGLFGDNAQSQPQSATTPPSDGQGTLKKQSSKRSSTNGPRPSFSGYRPLVRSQTTQGPAEKKEKRGSILGRLVRKFSAVRKSDSVISSNRTSFQAERRSQSQLPEPVDKKSARMSTSSPEKDRQSKATITSPATTEPEPPADSSLPSRTSVHAAETRSSISVDIEAPMTLGKLTIANPDAPSAATTPAKTEEPLPVNDVDTLSQHTLRPTAETPQSPPQPLESPRPLTHAPSQRESQIRNSVPPMQVQPVPEPDPEEDDDLPPPVPSKSPFFKRLHLASIPAESVLSLPGVIPTIPTEGTPSITDSPVEERFDPHLPTSPNFSVTNLRQRPPSPPSPTPAPTRAPQPVYIQELLEDALLSRASLYVNPGTPYVGSGTVIGQSRTTEIIKAQPVESSSQRQKSTNRSRETETFRLVRSPSGPDPEGQQTFLADGAHWEVENADQKKREANGSSRLSRHKAPSREASGEERRNSKRESADDRHHKRESTRESWDERSQRKETNEDRHHRKESRRSEGTRERDRDREREREDRKSRRDRSSRDSHLRQENKEKQRSSQVTPTSSSSNVPTRTSVTETYRRSDYTTRRSTVSSQQSFPREHDHERKASVSSRPTSEVPPTQMLNDLRAKEAWEMERIWKGRSMSINQEGSNVIASPMSTGGDLERNEDPYHNSINHGSSRTYFVVQAPVQGQSPSSQQNGIAFPSTSPKTNGSNHRTPPPEPLRPAHYQFQPLPQSLRTLDDPASKEYWAKLAGVSAASR